MFLLDSLDATRICARWERPDAAAWVAAAPAVVRAPRPVPTAYSWGSLARNPRAAMLTGMLAAMMAKDAVARAVAG